MSFKQRKNIMVPDVISFKNENSDEFIEARVVKDHYISDAAIHIMELQPLWSSIHGDLEFTTQTIEKRAEWLYLNASVKERGIKGRERIRKTKAKTAVKKQHWKQR